MKYFTSSQNIAISATADDQIFIAPKSDTSGDSTTLLLPAHSRALREFFRAEEDERLDRVRSQDDPDILIYPLGPDKVRVVNEASHGAADTFHRADFLSMLRRNGGALGPMSHAANRFFDAHPEPKPAWHEAKPWETWLIIVDGVEQSVTLDEDREFRDRRYAQHASWMHITSEDITAGRRVWPEVAS